MSPEPDNLSPESFGCARCYGEDAEAAWVGMRDFHCRYRLVDESHFGVSIRQCQACTQDYVWVFTEFIDWQDGDDPQYWDVLPVTPEEAEALAEQGEHVDLKQIETLGCGRRRLMVDRPKGGPKSITWASGPLSIRPGY